MEKETLIEGKASYRVACKLKILKNEIKKWSKDEGIKEEMQTNNILLHI